jgi:hypothetical protein
MNKRPNRKIDNATVIEYAWSGDEPFGFIRDSDGNAIVEIFGLALCKYDNDETIYRFSCDQNWETQQDSDYDSIDSAKNLIPEQYKNQLVVWTKYE